MSVLSTVTPLAGIADRSRPWFARFALLVLLFNIPVILWGAYVRVSYSGDGCGAHWPTCNGQFVPQKMTVPTQIEYTHRMMTGVDTALVIGLCAWAFVAFPKRHQLRRYAVLSLGFLFIEAFLGAGLVIFRYVAKDQSAGRAWYLSAHLTNTLLLIGALTATAWLAQHSSRRIAWLELDRRLWIALAATAFVAVTGAITALGDTLFPARSLAAGMHQDFAANSSLLLRLRVFHPLLAITAATYIVWLAAQHLRRSGENATTVAAGRVITVVVFQIVVGLVNTSLLAPVWLQLTHLFMADLLWMAVVVLTLELMPRPSTLELKA